MMKPHVLILAILYAASALMPAAHELRSALQGACETCRAAAAGNPSLQAVCDGSCGDPAHHHHSQHDRNHCPTCRWGYTPHSLPPASLSSGSIPDTGAPAPIGSQQPTPAADVRIAGARAPPLARLA